MGGFRWAAAMAALLVCLGGTPALAGQDQADDQGKAYAPRGADTCLKCHDKAPATHILKTAHAAKGDSRSPFAQRACESCHGASPEHLVKPPAGQDRAPPSVVFGKHTRNTVEERNTACLNCHQDGKLINWRGSQHQFGETACTDCHGMHSPQDRTIARETQPEVCFNCHKEQRAQSHKPSHHPIREGQTICSECHNVHGSPTPKLLAGATVNDTCYQCHAEKRGPLLWEHAPVREDCTICHTPHGSTQPRLLKVRVPFLCQECHNTSNHSSTLYSGATAVTTTQLYGRACLNCHSQVHGSNHPSGPKLNR